MFSHSGLYGASCVFLIGDSITAKTMASIPTKFCSTIKNQQVKIVGFTQGAKAAIYDCF